MRSRLVSVSRGSRCCGRITCCGILQWRSRVTVDDSVAHTGREPGFYPERPIM
jgi:hypothetical protein